MAIAKAVAGIGVGAIALFALVASAKAKSKPTLIPGSQAAADAKAKCDAAKAERANAKNMIAMFVAAQADIMNAQLIAYANGDNAQGDALGGQLKTATNNLKYWQGEANRLDGVIAACEA